MRKKWLVTYDISDDKKRKKVSNLLLEKGVRVQLSCFEIECTENELETLIKEIIRIIEPTDRVYMFPLTKNMEKCIVKLGIVEEPVKVI